MSYIQLSENEKRECSINSKGKIVMIVSAVVLFCACFAGGGTMAGVFGGIAFVGFIVGFFMVMCNRNKGTILYEKEMMLRKANLNIQMAQVGMNPHKEEVKVAEAQKAKKSETAEIIKGAVAGGIVAGEAGALVGAVIAKSKNDSNKKS
ncbi:MAG: hypothetical protein E7559_08825 [Ruminococcaceae bacterium]|nr:hypothetical protein [Oscillospiraceae bacterium]